MLWLQIEKEVYYCSREWTESFKLKHKVFTEEKSDEIASGIE
jgi:YHS domain-containing protein